MRNSSIKRWCIPGALLFVLSANSPYALSQDAEEFDEEFDAVLEQVIVTAQKRQETLQEIPISIQAVTGEKIENAGLNTLEMLSGYVPGLHITKAVLNTSINIRGIGSGINRGFEQSVGMYVDGIFSGRSRQFRSPFLDVGLVEVLRGPQAILFGRNTIAGAINVYTNNPNVDSDPEYRIAVKAEQFGTQEVTGYASGSTEQTGFRLAFKYRESDGYMENLTTGEDETALEERTGRFTFLYEPNDQLSINTKLHYSNFETEGDTNDIWYYKPIPQSAPGLKTILAGALNLGISTVFPEFNANDSLELYRDDSSQWPIGPTGSVTDTMSVGVTTTYEYDSGVMLTAVTGFSKYTNDDGNDVDFLPLHVLFGTAGEDFEQISQEIRFTYMEGEPFEYIGGIYLEQQELNQRSNIILDSSVGGLTSQLIAVPSALMLLPVLFPESFSGYNGAVNTSRFSRFNQDTENYAVFGEVIWYPGEDWRLSLGGRYSYQTKEIDKQLNVGSDATGGIDVATDDANLVNFWGVVMGSYPHQVEEDRSESYFDPSFKLQYNLSFDEMIYLSVSQGHKSGGFNASDDIPLNDDGTATAALEFDEEQARTVEVGWKTVLADGAVQYNVAVFFTKYDDLQVATFQGLTFAVGNAAEADIFGTEMDVRWAATRNLELGGSIAYLGFEFKNYKNGGCTAAQLVAYDDAGLPENGCRQDLSGERSAFAPRWSGNVFADYNRYIGGDVTFRTTLDLNFKDKMDVDYDRDPVIERPGFGKVNARIALETETWAVALYGRNITDKQTFGYVNDIPLYAGAYAGWVEEPRVYGVEASMNF